MSDRDDMIRAFEMLLHFRSLVDLWWLTPTTDHAFAFAFQEAAEAIDAHMRATGPAYARNSQRGGSWLPVAQECGDAVIMCLTALCGTAGDQAGIAFYGYSLPSDKEALDGAGLTGVIDIAGMTVADAWAATKREQTYTHAHSMLLRVLGMYHHVIIEMGESVSNVVANRLRRIFYKQYRWQPDGMAWSLWDLWHADWDHPRRHEALHDFERAANYAVGTVLGLEPLSHMVAHRLLEGYEINPMVSDGIRVDMSEVSDERSS